MLMLADLAQPIELRPGDALEVTPIGWDMIVTRAHGQRETFWSVKVEGWRLRQGSMRLRVTMALPFRWRMRAKRRRARDRVSLHICSISQPSRCMTG